MLNCICTRIRILWLDCLGKESFSERLILAGFEGRNLADMQRRTTKAFLSRVKLTLTDNKEAEDSSLTAEQREWKQLVGQYGFKVKKGYQWP